MEDAKYLIERKYEIVTVSGRRTATDCNLYLISCEKLIQCKLNFSVPWL